MDENSIREAAAVFALEEVSKLLGGLDEMRIAINADSHKLSNLLETQNINQLAMLEKVVQKLEAKSKAEIAATKKKYSFIVIISIIFVSGLVAGYFIEKLF